MELEDKVDSLTIQNNTLIPIKITSVPVIIPFLPFGLAIIIITLLGLIGNSISVLVFRRSRLRSSYTVLALGLTFCDTLYLITKLIRYGLDSMFTYFNVVSGYTNVFIPVVGPYLRPITFIAHTGSTYFTMALALDRCIAVYLPGKNRFICSRLRAKYYNGIIILFAILFNITRWWEFHTESKKIINPDGNLETVYSMKISSLRLHSDYKLYYTFWAYLVIMFILPFATLSILNLSLWLQISKIKKTTNTNSVQSRDNSFTLMLVGVVIVFLFCNLDYLILDLLDFFSIPYSEFWNYLGNVLLTINSAVNFLIYCICGRKFREELINIFHEWFGKSDRGIRDSDDEEPGVTNVDNNLGCLDPRLELDYSRL